jgi:hypothetical protein
MSEHFPDLTGWQLAVRVTFACGVTLAVIVGARERSFHPSG